MSKKAQGPAGVPTPASPEVVVPSASAHTLNQKSAADNQLAPGYWRVSAIRQLSASPSDYLVVITVSVAGEPDEELWCFVPFKAIAIGGWRHFRLKFERIHNVDLGPLTRQEWLNIIARAYSPLRGCFDDWTTPGGAK